MNKHLWASFIIAGNIIKNDYAVLLNGANLNNLLFLHRTEDRQVGALSAEEIAFLQSHGAKVTGFPDDQMLDERDFLEMLDFIRK